MIRSGAIIRRLVYLGRLASLLVLGAGPRTFLALAAAIVPVLIAVAVLTLVGKDATGFQFGTDRRAYPAVESA